MGSLHFLQHKILPLSWDYYLALDANILSSESIIPCILSLDPNQTMTLSRYWIYYISIYFLWFQGWSQHLPLPSQGYWCFSQNPAIWLFHTIPISLSLSLSLSFSVPFLFPLSFPFLLPFLSIPPMSIPGSMTQYCLMPALVPRLTPFNYISSELIDNESKQAATTSLCKRARFASLLAKRRSGAARRAT